MKLLLLVFVLLFMVGCTTTDTKSPAINDDKFEDYVHEKVKVLSEAATVSLAMVKKAVRFGTQAPLNIGLQFEQLGFGITSASKDVSEGITAFLQKREPKFKGF